MPLALAALLLAISLTSCSRPDGRLAERAHQLLNEGKLQQAQESLQDGFRQFPQSVALRQERLHLNLLAGQPELAAAEAHQILQTQPSAQPYRLPLRDPSPGRDREGGGGRVGPRVGFVKFGGPRPQPVRVGPRGG